MEVTDVSKKSIHVFSRTHRTVMVEPIQTKFYTWTPLEHLVLILKRDFIFNAGSTLLLW